MRTIVVLSRRDVLGLAAVMLCVSAAKGSSAAPCAAPDGTDGSLRESLHYAETAPNPAQTCSGCAFFSNAVASCGQCQIFNGPVNVNGHCDSWAARG